MTASAPSSRQRWLVPVVVVVLSVTVGAGLLARERYRRPDQPADSSVLVSTPASSNSGKPAVLGAVAMTPDAASHPEAEAVRRLLETYFDATNAKDYKRWVSVLSAAQAQKQNPGDWKAGVRSTKDMDALVYRIERGANDSLRVLVGFTSTQDKKDAPSFFQEACIKWRVVMPVIKEGGALKIDSFGAQPETEKC